MMWEYSAYCRRCKKRVYVQHRYYSMIGFTIIKILTIGFYSLLQFIFPHKFGQWMCDECGSYSCVSARKVKENNLKKKKHIHHRPYKRHNVEHRHQ